MFPSFNLSMFTEEDGMVLLLTMKAEKNLKCEKMPKLTQFCNFKELQEKMLKIGAQAFEAGDFLNIFF